MPVIPFGELLPDLPDFQNGGMTVANNCLPVGAGYKPFYQPRVSSDALGARCRGFISHETSSGVYYTYAGDATKLYILASDITWTADTPTYSLTSADNWEFVHWDTKLIATCITDEPVEDTIGTGAFATFMTSTNKPKAHHIATVGDFLVLGDVVDSSGTKRSRVTWSAIGDYTDFDADVSTLAGAQDLRGETSQVNKIIGGGNSGIIFQAESIWKMTFEGPPTIFRFDQISQEIGCISKRGAAKLDDAIFFLSTQGFQLMSASQGSIRPIGRNRVDDTILGEINLNELHLCSTIVDPFKGVFLFSYPTGSGKASKIAAYNPVQDRWSFIEYDHQVIGVQHAGAFDIDSAPLATRNIDTDPYNIDGAEFKGGQASIAGFNTDNKMVIFDGTAFTATFETGEAAFQQGHRNYVNRARPLVSGSDATATVSLGTRETLAGTSSFGTAASLNAEGEASVRGSGRYMKFRTEVSGGFDDAVGIEVDSKQKGRK